MATRRFSRLQKRLLAWLATDERRTRGVILSSHQDLVGALQGDKGNISHSLRTLEARGLLVIVRSRGGKAEALSLTAEGQKWARQFAGSCDEEWRARKMGAWETATASRYAIGAPVVRGEAPKARGLEKRRWHGKWFIVK